MNVLKANLLLFYLSLLAATFAQAEVGTSSQMSAQYTANFNYTHDSFSEDLEPWEQLSVSCGYNSKFGKIIARSNTARRFGESGQQFEVDSYPHLGEGRYAYLNLGQSHSSIFPNYRFGAELFQSMGQGFEVSGGFRKLWFAESDPTIWTGSVAKYYGPYYFAIRPFYVPKAIGDSWSGFIEIRRYLDDTTFLDLKAGVGESSDQRASTLEVFDLKSRWISTGVNWQIHNTTAITGSFSIENMEPRPQAERQQRTISLGLEQKF